jgi:hypothetical protein
MILKLLGLDKEENKRIRDLKASAEQLEKPAFIQEARRDCIICPVFQRYNIKGKGLRPAGETPLSDRQHAILDEYELALGVFWDRIHKK